MILESWEVDNKISNRQTLENAKNQCVNVYAKLKFDQSFMIESQIRWWLSPPACLLLFVGNKEKEQISKRVFQENKARQIFRKMNISYPLIRTFCISPYSVRMRENTERAYQGVRNVRFSENLACFVFLKHPFWDSPFCLVTNKLHFKVKLSIFDSNVL